MSSSRSNSRLVYSSDAGRVCPECGRASSDCRCTSRSAADEPVPVRLVVKLRLERAGRGGKSVTVLYDLPRNVGFLDELARDLKRSCGVGGSVRDDTIELQGDVRERVRELLAKRGYGIRG